MEGPISVTYTFVDGAHFFTADDTKWAGLCAASTDMQAAWDDVAVQLEILAEINHGQKIKFKPVESFSDFMRKLLGEIEAALDRFEGEDGVAETKARVAKLKEAMDKPKAKPTPVRPTMLKVKAKRTLPTRAHMIWRPMELAAA